MAGVRQPLHNFMENCYVHTNRPATHRLNVPPANQIPVCASCNDNRTLPFSLYLQEHTAEIRACACPVCRQPMEQLEYDSWWCNGCIIAVVPAMRNYNLAEVAYEAYRRGVSLATGDSVQERDLKAMREERDRAVNELQDITIVQEQAATLLKKRKV